MLAELHQTASGTFRLQGKGSGNGGKTKQLTPPYCLARSRMPLWAGCSTASAPFGAGGKEMSSFGVDMSSKVCYTPCPGFPARWGALPMVYAQWEVIEKLNWWSA